MKNAGCADGGEWEIHSRQMQAELASELETVSECASFEAAELLRQVCGLDRARLLLGKEISPEEAGRLRTLARRRLAGEPLQYLLGEWDFYGRTFRVGEGVLIPRADTETLVEAALSFAGGRALSVADLCAGSGCVALTLALELPGSHVIAVEKSGAAFCYLRKNADALCPSAELRRDDVLCPSGRYPRFDLIVSNPPYIVDADMETLQPEVRREPEMALRGGRDGLRFYRGIVEIWTKWLKPGGMLAFEIGRCQEGAVQEIMENKCFENVCFHRDLCGIIRVVTGIQGERKDGHDKQEDAV